MQKAFIIIIMVIFIVTSIGFFVTMMGGGAPVDPEEREQQERERELEPEIDEDEVSYEIPDYVRQAGVDYRGAVDWAGDETEEIVLGGNYFQPTAIRVDVGATLTWRNQDENTHTVTSDPESPESGLDSGDIEPDEGYEYTFDEPGQYNYVCEHHPASMRGVIIVE